jgi:uncharacterized RDD family membrane protein YckC
VKPAGPEVPPTASWARRMLALVVDWFASTLVAVVIVGPERYGETGGSAQFATFAVYVVEAALFTWLLGGSFGKLATRLRTVPADGVLRPMSPLRLLVRQVLVVLVIPPLVFRPDGRGLHDLAAGTATVTLDTYRGLLAARGGGSSRA